MLDRMQNSNSKYHFGMYRSIAWEQSDRYNDDQRVLYRKKRIALVKARSYSRFSDQPWRSGARVFLTHGNVPNNLVDPNIASGDLYREKEKNSVGINLRMRLQERSRRGAIVRGMRKAGHNVADMRLVLSKDGDVNYDGKFVYTHFANWLSANLNNAMTICEDNCLLRRCEKIRLFTAAFHGGMKKYIVQQSCGCCDSELYFKSEENMRKAFEAAGLTSSGVIVDDMGNKFEGIDTFYGVRGVEEDRRGLGYLMDQVLDAVI